MNKLIVFLLLVIVTGVNAQVGIKVIKNGAFTSNAVSINEKSNVITYIGNVAFVHNVMEVRNATKIVYNATSKEMIVTGAESFTFDGEIEVSEADQATRIRCKIGKRVACAE